MTTLEELWDYLKECERKGIDPFKAKDISPCKDSDCSKCIVYCNKRKM